MTTSTTFRRWTAALFAAIALGWLALASPAAAHVSVSSADATAGGEGKLTFRVPNESDKASTTKVTVKIPTSVVFTEASAETKGGWQADVREAKLPKAVIRGGTTITRAVRTVIWTATSGGIPTDQFDEFSIAVEGLPRAKTVHFSVTQRYDDGTVVRWNQHGSEDQVEHPAPTLALTKFADGTTSGVDGLARVLAIAALVAAIAGSLASLGQNRRRADTA